jgi:hypothetical protein
MSSDIYHSAAGQYDSGGVYRVFSSVEDQRGGSYERYNQEYIMLSQGAQFGIDLYSVPVRHAMMIEVLMSGGFGRHEERGIVITGNLDVENVEVGTRNSRLFSALRDQRVSYSGEIIWENMRSSFNTKEEENA